MRVHGAAVTHLLFLRPSSVLVQVVPVGVEWATYAFFGTVADSSLVDKYGKNNLLLKDHLPFRKKMVGQLRLWTFT